MFTTGNNSEPWIIDKLLEHRGHNIDIEVLGDEVSVYCNSCHEIVVSVNCSNKGY